MHGPGPDPHRRSATVGKSHYVSGARECCPNTHVSRRKISTTHAHAMHACAHLDPADKATGALDVDAGGWAVVCPLEGTRIGSVELDCQHLRLLVNDYLRMHA